MLQRAVDWVLNDKMFADLKTHDNTKWAVRRLVALAVLAAWSAVLETMREVQPNLSISRKARRPENNLSVFLNQLRALIQSFDGGDSSVRAIVVSMTKFLGVQAVKRCFPQYAQGSHFNKIHQQIFDQLKMRLAAGRSWLEAVIDLEGDDSVPVMSIHKSKGLEYHTVVFVGLEDSSFWNFAQQPDEEKCSFFVAFSRAITRVIFTFCQTRPREVGGHPEQQNRKAIGVLYQLLQEAGVEPEEVVFDSAD